MIVVLLEGAKEVIMQLPFTPGAGNLQRCIERWERLKNEHPDKMSGVLLMGSDTYMRWYNPKVLSLH